LIQNSFTEVMAEHQLLDLSSFAMLLEAQYSASLFGPTDNPARWAVVNAVTALAIRVKTAPGSEGDISDISRGFYDNATVVIPEIILQAPSLLSVQALLAMAMFAQGTPDAQACVMLASNASRQLELLALGRLSASQAVDIREGEQYKKAYIIAHTLEKITLRGDDI
jgi:hypothetical protein